MKQNLTALLTGRPHVSDLTTLRSEYQDLTRQLEAMRTIAASLDEDAHATMQQPDEGPFMLPSPLSSVPTTAHNNATMVSATLSNSYSNAIRNISLLAMTDFNQTTKGPRLHSATTSRGGNSNVQPVWESDKDAACCKQCKKKFIAVVRNRHHCRCCGYVFCGKCTSHRMSLPEFGYFELVRVCRVCFNSGSGSDEYLHDD
ncbi:hypothetical protein AaE_002373 [Aphanomyces astaci]|uniref:FYVE-type domain-containing protein n=1 Tax=Aphanomyces astaci TaxID=112090 RepID=A0A6A5ANW5_APHAT|nr:hypothetical protein AaE_002373 [Aphanomyces astaci]